MLILLSRQQELVKKGAAMGSNSGVTVRFFLLVSGIIFALSGCGGQRTASAPPGSKASVDIPVYGGASLIKVDQSDVTNLLLDFGAGSLPCYEHSSTIFATTDAADKVSAFYDKDLPSKNWRLESDWENWEKYRASMWKRGDVHALVFLLDNLTSSEIDTLWKRFGLEGLKPGYSLVVLLIWDESRPLPTPTPLPTNTPTPTRTPSPTWTPRPTVTTPPSPTPVPTFTPVPDTREGSVLEIGQPWSSLGVQLVLTKAEVRSVRDWEDAPIRIWFTFNNLTKNTINLQFSKNDIYIIDDRGERYVEWYGGGVDGANVNAGKSFNFDYYMSPSPRTRYRVPSEVSSFVLHVQNFSRIGHAQWRVNIVR